MTLTRHGGAVHEVAFAAASLVIAMAVFAVDTLTSIEGAIAVLYVVALLLAAEAVNRAGLLLLTVIFIALSLVSFLFIHGPEPDIQTFIRLTVAIAALCVTTALLLRNERARTALLLSNYALRESEARYRSIFDRTRVALWERDYSKLREYLIGLKLQGLSDIKAYGAQHPDFYATCIGLIEIVAANEAAGELLGQSANPCATGVMHRFIPSQSEAFAAVLQAILDGASYYEGNAEVITETGERRAVLLSISFPHHPLAFNRVVVSMVDVTQREEARKVLADAQAELSIASKAATVGVLSASLAHELNQPLGAIGVNAQTLVRWLDRDPPDLDAATRSAERILRDSTRASDIIKNTRTLLSSQTKPDEAIDLDVLVDDTLALMEHDLQREGTVVEVVQRVRLPRIVGIRIELQQVLINLISNAIQAISAAAADKRIVTILIDAAAGGDQITLAVHDTGNGLSPEVLQKLFTPFFTTKATGMGMGLSICRSAIEANGGSLTGCNHPDGGAVFEIKIPRGKAVAYKESV